MPHKMFKQVFIVVSVVIWKHFVFADLLKRSERNSSISKMYGAKSGGVLLLNFLVLIPQGGRRRKLYSI